MLYPAELRGRGGAWALARVIAWAVGGFRDVLGGCAAGAGAAAPTESEANASKAVPSRRQAASAARRGGGARRRAHRSTVPYFTPFIRCVAATRARRMPGSMAEWPASGTVTYWACGQACLSSQALCGGQITS